jgi:ATP-dependent DNA helicase DinG
MSYSISLTDNPRDFVADALKVGGLFSSLIPGFEERSEQTEMALAVWDSLNNGENLLVEAGTGVGKSLAYILPAALLAFHTKKRAIISTHTVNLQEQLVSKDIPLVAKAFEEFGFNLQYGLMKGRSHYVCLRRLKQASAEVDRQESLWLLSNEEKVLSDILGYINAGKWDGDRDNLSFPISESVWNEISSESGRCMGINCPERETCPYQAKRTSLEKCHLIVVNHALFMSHIALCSDTKGKIRLLPPFDIVIFDEAHHLEECARDALGIEVSQARFKRLADDTVRLSTRNSLGDILSKDEQRHIRALLDNSVSSLGNELRTFEPHGYQEQKLRIRDTNTIDMNFIESVNDFTTILEDWESLDLSDEERFEVSSLRRRFKSLISDLIKIVNLEGDGDSYVYWAEKEGVGRRTAVVVKRAPLEVGPYLAENLWQGLETGILTSATLATNGCMKHARFLLGIEEANELILGSPFNYKEQACFCIPRDSRNLDVNSSYFDEYTARKVIEIIDMTQGRTFVLFTRRKSMESVASMVRDKIESRGFPFLKQGDEPRDVLLTRFKESGNAVLFGLASFWEGVDVPGSALSCVILTKIPFPVFNDPVMKAREELWKSQGLTPFIHYSLPQATLKLKQGFGRLIRTKTDKGAIVLLDSRILYKNYGRSILTSLPPARFTRDLDEIAAATRE